MNDTGKPLAPAEPTRDEATGSVRVVGSLLFTAFFFLFTFFYAIF